MFDFANVDAKMYLTSDYILSKIDESAIWCNYYGSFKLNKAYQSRLRKDRNPSTAFRINDRGKIHLIDFSTNEKLNCFEFIQKLYNCNFFAALNIIAKDFGLLPGSIRNITQETLNQSKLINLETKQKTLIQFIPDQWNNENLKYWNEYKITKEELELEKVYPVKKLFINKQEIYGSEIRYVYIVNYPYEDKIITGVKVLSPYDTNMKWLSSIPLSYMGDIDTLQYKSDTVFICKSKKDKIVLSKLFTDVCWTQNESSEAFPIDIQDMLLNRFKKRIIVYGSDHQGVAASQNFTAKGFSWFNIPNEELENGINDPAEYIKAYGLDKLKELFKNKDLIQN